MNYLPPMQLLRKEKTLQDVLKSRIQHNRYRGLGKESRNQLPRKEYCCRGKLKILPIYLRALRKI